jgi:signal transduction histidine kinase
MTWFIIARSIGCANMESMKRTKIEPGILQVFRIFIGIRLLLILISLRLQARVPTERIQLYLSLLLIEAAILLVYLTWPWLQMQIGRAYLPVAILYATVSPIFEQVIAMFLRHANILQGDTSTGGVWGLTILLLVPMILVSWQYRFRTLAFYVLATAIFELVLTGPIASAIALDMPTVFGIVFIRSLLFLLIGWIIVRLMKAQREQRAELARANLELARHASTIEQLATSRERNRLARELHDTLAHTLSGLAVQMEGIHSIWEEDPQGAHDLLDQSLKTIREGLQEARRAIHALRASPLEDLGLLLALRSLSESAAERANIELDLKLPNQLDHLNPDLEHGIYRIAEQAVANIIQHSNAAHMSVGIAADDGRLTLSVKDDGCGFDPETVDLEAHFGLQGMQERANMIGGTLDIQSHPGGGTAIHLIVEGIDDPHLNL